MNTVAVKSALIQSDADPQRDELRFLSERSLVSRPSALRLRTIRITQTAAGRPIRARYKTHWEHTEVRGHTHAARDEAELCHQQRF